MLKLKIKKSSLGLLFLLAAAVIGLQCNPSMPQKTDRINLSKQQLRLYDLPYRLTERIVHKGSNSFLAVETEIDSYYLTCRAYSEHKRGEQLFERVFEVKDSAGLHVFPLPTALPNFSLVFNLVPNVQEQLPNYRNIHIVERYTEGPQSLYWEDENGQLILGNCLAAGQSFVLKHRSDSVKQFYLNYFSHDFTTSPRPDSDHSGFFNPLRGREGRLVFEGGKRHSLRKEGLYFVQTDTQSNKGVFLHCMDADFPEMTRLEDLLLSIRYISTNEEYYRLQRSEDKKKALDEFWLARNDDKEVARQLIRIYYNRILAANRFFTTFKAGWKTDRGLIFSIFGVPAEVYRYPQQELWRYYLGGGRSATDFHFRKVEEEYILQRGPYLGEVWDRQIRRWRQGLIQE